VIVLAAFVAANWIVTEDSQICSDKNVIVPRSKYITDENTPNQLQNRRTAFSVSSVGSTPTGFRHSH
jgi:hypothetical protein